MKNTSIAPSTTLILEKSGAIPGDINLGGALCIRSRSWYGQTFNRILQLANALTIIADSVNNNATNSSLKQSFIGLAPRLSGWYGTFFDKRRDIILNYEGPCVSIWTSKDIFMLRIREGQANSFSTYYQRKLSGTKPKKLY